MPDHGSPSHYGSRSLISTPGPVRTSPFVEILRDTNMIAAFGDDETAIVMYDTETVPVKSAPGAECVTVRDGKIVHSWFVFDRSPFEAARRGTA